MSQTPKSTIKAVAHRTDDIARLKQHLNASGMVYHDFAQEQRQTRVVQRWPLLGELAARLADTPPVKEQP